MNRVYGVLAEFDSISSLIEAAKEARDIGFRKMDAYTPFPNEELAHILGYHKSRLPLITLIAGLIGTVTGAGLCYWVHVIAYPLNFGGKPLNSWPAFVPITFETTILFAGIGVVLGFFAICGLPQPYHPLFNDPRFGLASNDRFFLCIEADDPYYNEDKVKQLLGKKAVRVTTVDF